MAGRRETNALKPIDEPIGRMGASGRAVKARIATGHGRSSGRGAQEERQRCSSWSQAAGLRASACIARPIPVAVDQWGRETRQNLQATGGHAEVRLARDRIRLPYWSFALIGLSRVA
jgi:hypothetical protein